MWKEESLEMNSLEKKKIDQDICSFLIFEEVAQKGLAQHLLSKYLLITFYATFEAENTTWKKTDMVLASNEFIGGRQTTN